MTISPLSLILGIKWTIFSAVPLLDLYCTYVNVLFTCGALCQKSKDFRMSQFCSLVLINCVFIFWKPLWTLELFLSKNQVHYIHDFSLYSLFNPMLFIFASQFSSWLFVLIFVFFCMYSYGSLQSSNSSIILSLTAYSRTLCLAFIHDSQQLYSWTDWII